MRIAGKFFLQKTSDRPNTCFMAFLAVLWAGSLGASPALAQEAAVLSNESVEKSATKTGDKVIESAKKVLGQLDKVPDETSLEELNRARQTISRIEAMIEVERRLGELDRLRKDRRGGQGAVVPEALINAIPMQALGLPSKPSVSSAFESDGAGFDRPMSSSRPQVSRIYGVGGKYTAVLKYPGGITKPVNAGDKISANEVVKAISPMSVEIGGKGKGSQYTLYVKDVAVVHGAVR